MLNVRSGLVKLFFVRFPPETLPQCDIPVALGQGCRILSPDDWSVLLRCGLMVVEGSGYLLEFWRSAAHFVTKIDRSRGKCRAHASGEQTGIKIAHWRSARGDWSVPLAPPCDCCHEAEPAHA